MKRVEKKSANAYVHRVGWLRVSPRWSAKRQREALAAVDLAAVYTTVDGDTFGDLLLGMRPGNEVYMLGLHRIAETVREARAHMAALRAAGGKITATRQQHEREPKRWSHTSHPDGSETYIID